MRNQRTALGGLASLLHSLHTTASIFLKEKTKLSATDDPKSLQYIDTEFETLASKAEQVIKALLADPAMHAQLFECQLAVNEVIYGVARLKRCAGTEPHLAQTLPRLLTAYHRALMIADAPPPAAKASAATPISQAEFAKISGRNPGQVSRRAKDLSYPITREHAEQLAAARDQPSKPADRRAQCKSKRRHWYCRACAETFSTIGEKRFPCPKCGSSALDSH